MTKHARNLHKRGRCSASWIAAAAGLSLAVAGSACANPKDMTVSQGNVTADREGSLPNIIGAGGIILANQSGILTHDVSLCLPDGPGWPRHGALTQ